MLDRTLLDRAALARKLNTTVERLYRHLPGMIAAEGFPPPVWGNSRGARWDPAAIDAWLDSKLPGRAAANSNAPAARAAEANPDADAALLDARAALIARRT